MEDPRGLTFFYGILIATTLTGMIAAYFKGATPEFKLRLRKLTTLTLLATSGAAFADGIREHRPSRWVMPAIFIGAVVLNAFLDVFAKEKTSGKADDDENDDGGASAGGQA